jgi:hypothetical protein
MSDDQNFLFEQVKLWLSDGVSKKDLFDRITIMLHEKRITDQVIIRKLQGFAANQWHRAELESKLKTSQDLNTNERIDAAFFALEEKGIFAKQNFTCCSSCGHSEAFGVITERRANGRPGRGYAFYHQQDTESGKEGHGLYIAFGAFEDGEEASLKIAQEISQTFTECGIEHDWNENSRTRLYIKPFVWHKQKSVGGVIIPADKPWCIVGHPDGRIWAGRIENGQLELRIKDNEGDVSSKKPRAREPHQELRRMLQDLLSDSFVMMHSKDLPALPE